jgi:crotonobetainyl-CoA:carnitine CoA-transferase CaiB-like acyl-CoA transferase
VSLPLDGVRVLELATAWAGPFVGRFLAALGAAVVKVESARQVDGWRLAMPPGRAMREVPPGVDPDAPNVNVAPNFNALNRSKRGVAVDLTTPDGRKIALELVACSDVVVANFTSRVLPQLRLTWDDMRAVNPAVVLLSMPALGASGPYHRAAGYGTIIEGMGGLASRFGYEHEGARVSDTYYPDAVAGVHASVAVLAALARRRRTGDGMYLDMSQQEVMWLQLGEGIVHASATGREPGRMGNREPGCATSGCFATRDGRFAAIVTRTASEAERLSAVAGEDVGDWCLANSLEDVVSELGRAGVGVAPVNTYREAASDPALEAVSAFECLDHPVTGRHRYLRVPVRLDGSPLASTRPAPRFHEHTHEVLDELGYGTAAVQRLESSGAIGGEPRGPARG